MVAWCRRDLHWGWLEKEGRGEEPCGGLYGVLLAV